MMEEIEHLEQLAALKLTDEERSQAKRDLSEMVRFFERIREADTSASEGSERDAICPLREDEVTGSDDKEETLLNAPERKGDFFAIPKTV